MGLQKVTRTKFSNNSLCLPSLTPKNTDMYTGTPYLYAEPDPGEDRLRVESYAPKVDGVPVPVSVLVPLGCDNVTRIVEVRLAVSEFCRTVWGPGRLIMGRVGYRWEREAALVA